MREPYPERSLGMLVKFIMLRSPIRFLRLVILRLTYPWRSLANLYSAFSERSPWARATAISLGRSTLSSCSSAVSSSWIFCLIFFNGSDIANRDLSEQGKIKLEPQPQATVNYTREVTNYRWGRIAATRDETVWQWGQREKTPGRLTTLQAAIYSTVT